MNTFNKGFVLVLVLVGLIITGLSVFEVNETERALVLRLGKMVVDSKTGQPRILAPGLHCKVPLLDSVLYFDRRIQSLEIPSSRIPTQEKKELIVDLFTKWRILNFSEYYKRTGGNKARAERLLREKIVDGLRGEFGRRKLNDVVSQDRQKVMDKIRFDANNTAKTLGIEVVDARILRIDLPQEVSEAVFNLMRTERQRVAAEHRAQGRSRAEAIRADADAKVIIIGAMAERSANQLRGEGEATAAQIYSAVYGKDPEFYSFWRSLEAYRETFKSGNDILVIKPDDAFFKYFRNSQGSRTAAQKS
jgi:membrane protease subunit HflC